MIANLVPTLLRLIFLVGFQVLVLNNIQLYGYLNPNLYILFLILLPPKMSQAQLMTIGFGLGVIIDLFENSGGIHASACVLLGVLRPYLLRPVAPRAKEEYNSIGMSELGVGKFLVYAGLCVLVHHFWLFAMEAFSLSEILSVIYRTILSTFITLTMIYMTQLFFYRNT